MSSARQQLGVQCSQLGIGEIIPGGAAPLASTALMTVTLARVAGVLEIVACTPADRSVFMVQSILTFR